MKQSAFVDGEALAAVEGRLGHEAPLPSSEVIRHLQRAVDLFGNPSRLAKSCGMPQPILWRMLNGTRAVYAEAAVAIEAATQGVVDRGQLRPDLWLGYEALPEPPARTNASDCDPDDGVDVTHLCGAASRLAGPDRIAAEEGLIRAYLDARHRLDAAKAALLAVMGVDRV